MNSKENILVIPATARRIVRKRQLQVARALSLHYNVYVLSWDEPKKAGFLSRIKSALTDFFRKTKIYEEDGLKFVRISICHRPLWFLKFYNSWSIRRFIKKNDIDTVINGIHYFFFTPATGKKLSYRHIFDVNDLPAESDEGALDRFMHKFVKHEIGKADHVTACSGSLSEYIEEEYGRKPVTVPNGTYLDEFSQDYKRDVDELKKSLGFSGKHIMGYIGFAGHWTDIGFMINFYKKCKQKYDDAALLIVGEGPEIDRYRNVNEDKDIVFTGGVSGDSITPYFKLLDIGLLPSRKSLFQDMAFHTKLIEYSAARKYVISANLKEVVKLGFPNIFTDILDVESWFEIYRNIRDRKWDSSWDDIIRPYDWVEIGNKFTGLLEE